MRFVLTALTLLFFFITGISQNDCKPYVPADKGTVWEISNYNAKGKLTGTIVYELLEKEISGNEILFKVKNTTFDKKGVQMATNTFIAKCVDGKFEFDMTYKMDANSMQAFGDMEVDVDATDFEIPDMDTAPGTQLEDGSLKISALAGGAMAINLTILITERVIEARESYTTSAGEFDCIVLKQKVSTKMMVNITAYSKEWYAPYIGMIRSESYNKKGKLTGYSELTKLTKV